MLENNWRIVSSANASEQSQILYVLYHVYIIESVLAYCSSYVSLFRRSFFSLFWGWKMFFGFVSTLRRCWNKPVRIYTGWLHAQQIDNSVQLHRFLVAPQGATLRVTLRCRPVVYLSVHGRTPPPPLETWFLGSSGNFKQLLFWAFFFFKIFFHSKFFHPKFFSWAVGEARRSTMLRTRYQPRAVWYQAQEPQAREFCITVLKVDICCIQQAFQVHLGCTWTALEGVKCTNWTLVWTEVTRFDI